MVDTSPRSTQLYQTDACAPMLTAPITIAPGATKHVTSICACVRSRFNSDIGNLTNHSRLRYSVRFNWHGALFRQPDISEKAVKGQNGQQVTGRARQERQCQ